jgi:hypothetical protein
VISVKTGSLSNSLSTRLIGAYAERIIAQLIMFPLDLKAAVVITQKLAKWELINAQ